MSLNPVPYNWLSSFHAGPLGILVGEEEVRQRGEVGLAGGGFRRVGWGLLVALRLDSAVPPADLSLPCLHPPFLAP